MKLSNVNESGRDEHLPPRMPRKRRTYDTIELWEADFQALQHMNDAELRAWVDQWHVGFPITKQS